MRSWLRKSLGMTPATDPVALTNVGQGGFNFEVVGEQSYQSHLQKLSGGREERGERIVVGCQLRYEINPRTHGPAVRVDAVGAGTVGHFPAEQEAASSILARRTNMAELQNVLVREAFGQL
jgi:hypothetical protein